MRAVALTIFAQTCDPALFIVTLPECTSLSASLSRFPSLNLSCSLCAACFRHQRLLELSSQWAKPPGHSTLLVSRLPPHLPRSPALVAAAVEESSSGA
ncbi:hypothetical protein K438DRAFT_1982656 [Mycena galopus ATCC 62051]|nr:hypothetical protein K438DRAFT_1982656 [Mycena galopus ATCC 62051]